MTWLTPEQKEDLERGVSPDDLPINPPKIKFTECQPGHHSYRTPVIKNRRHTGEYRTEWFTIRKR